jgi:hypothetical protein
LHVAVFFLPRLLFISRRIRKIHRMPSRFRSSLFRTAENDVFDVTANRHSFNSGFFFGNKGTQLELGINCFYVWGVSNHSSDSKLTINLSFDSQLQLGFREKSKINLPLTDLTDQDPFLLIVSLQSGGLIQHQPI